jgi:hypothetical protein
MTSEKVFIDSPTIVNIVAQLGPAITTNKWLIEPPPADMMRGVDFYNATDFVSALMLSAQVFKNTHGFLPQLTAPASFNEHIFVRKFFALLPLPSLADKLGVREYVRKRLGDGVLIPVVWTGIHVEELFTAPLPAGRFVLKANHGAGMNLFLDLPQDLVTRRDEIQSKARRWLANRYGYGWGEWHYNVFKPRLFLEAFYGRDKHDRGSGEPMDDFKIHCFHGKARLIHIVTGRFTRPRLGQYTPDWRYLAVGMPGYDSIEFPRPKALDTIVASAERLAQGLDYARIDLYAGDRDLKFGEITLTPGNAHQRYSDFDFDRWLGGYFTPGAAQPEWGR